MNTNHARNWEQKTFDRAPQEKKQVKVQKQSWVTKGEKMLYLLFSILFLTAGFFIVMYSSSTDALNRDLQSLEQSVHKQEVVNDGLLFEIKELSTPERITEIAKEKGLKIQDGEIKHAQAVNNN